VTEDQPGGPRTQHVHVIDAVRAGKHPLQQRHHLPAGKAPAVHPALSHTDSFTRSSIPSRSASLAVNRKPAVAAYDSFLPAQEVI
jgi:hypothetical protein